MQAIVPYIILLYIKFALLKLEKMLVHIHSLGWTPAFTSVFKQTS